MKPRDVLLSRLAPYLKDKREIIPDIIRASDRDEIKVITRAASMEARVMQIFRVRYRDDKDSVFESYVKDHGGKRGWYWHGSDNANWPGIINDGLLLSAPVANGTAYGKGHYMALDPKTSLSYTSPVRRPQEEPVYIGLFEVAEQDETAMSGGKDILVFYDNRAVILRYIVEFEK